MSLDNQYVDAVQSGLMKTPATPAERAWALATLTLIIRHLGWQSYTCEKTATDLAEMQGADKGDMARILALLEGIGAIDREKRGSCQKSSP